MFNGVSSSLKNLLKMHCCLVNVSENEREMGLRNQTEAQAMVALDNKQNLAQREQYYAAVHKGMTTPVRDLHCIEQIPGKTLPKSLCS